MVAENDASVPFRIRIARIKPITVRSGFPGLSVVLENDALPRGDRDQVCSIFQTHSPTPPTHPPAEAHTQRQLCPAILSVQVLETDNIGISSPLCAYFSKTISELLN